MYWATSFSFPFPPPLQFPYIKALQFWNSTTIRRNKLNSIPLSSSKEMKSSLSKLRGLAGFHKHGHGGDHKNRRNLLSLAQFDELAEAYRVLLSLSTARLVAEKSTEIHKLLRSFWTCQTFVNRFVSFLFRFDFSSTKHDLKITSFFLLIYNLHFVFVNCNFYLLLSS